jgi:hypothetical protein
MISFIPSVTERVWSSEMVLAGSQQTLGVWKLAHDLNGFGLRVYLAIREDDSAGMWVSTPVGQGHLQRDS